MVHYCLLFMEHLHCSAKTVLFCGKCKRTVFCLPLHFSVSASADDVDADVDADADFAATAKCALAIRGSFGSKKVSVFVAVCAVQFSAEEVGSNYQRQQQLLLLGGGSIRRSHSLT